MKLHRTRVTRSKDEAIELLLAISHSEFILEQMYVGLEQTIRASVQYMLRAQTLSPDQEQALRRVPAKVIAALREECNWSVLQPQLRARYKKTFDRQKLDGLIRFYRSLAGRAFRQRIAAQVHGSVALAQARAHLLLPKMKQAMDKEVQEAQRVRKRAAASPGNSSSRAHIRRSAQR